MSGLYRQSPAPRPPSPVSSHQPARGISLLEVLISMGVLVVGLLSVAAIIPAGRIEIGQGTKVDHAAMVGRAAFREIKVRGMLNLANWMNANGTPYTAGSGSNSVVFDPLGLAAGFPSAFPTGWPVPAPVRLYPHYSLYGNGPLADSVFRGSDDLIFNANTSKNTPPLQQMMGGNAKRGSLGDYSWLATVYSDPTYAGTTSEVRVSVAVFYKRDLSSPTNSETFFNLAAMPGPIGENGGEVLIQLDPTNPQRFARPGQWIALSNNLATAFAWYRVVSADAPSNTPPAYYAGPPGLFQSVALAGPKWYEPSFRTFAFVFENVVAVYEKQMRLELP